MAKLYMCTGHTSGGPSTPLSHCEQQYFDVALTINDYCYRRYDLRHKNYVDMYVMYAT